jgi:hypothetical protein
VIQGLIFRRLVSAQAVVNGGNLRQCKISERDALVIGGKQNDVREHVANLADNVEQDCVLCVCHGSTRDPFRSSKSPRLIGLSDPSRAIFWTEHSGQKGPPRLPDANRERPRDNWVQPVGRPRPTGCSNRSAGDRRNNSQPPALDQRRPLYSRANKGALCGKVPRGPSSTTSDGPFFLATRRRQLFVSPQVGTVISRRRGAARRLIGCDARHTSKILWDESVRMHSAHPANPTASETIGSVLRCSPKQIEENRWRAISRTKSRRIVHALA